MASTEWTLVIVRNPKCIHNEYLYFFLFLKYACFLKSTVFNSQIICCDSVLKTAVTY